METKPLVSFDKHNSTSGLYIDKVMLGSIPKMLIIVSETYVAISYVSIRS